MAERLLERAERFSGNALLQARGWRSFSQRELAERSSVSAETIRKLESGLVERPSCLTVGALAEALSVPISFLEKEPEESPPAHSLHMRSRRRVKQSYVGHVLAVAGVFSRVVARLEDQFDFPPEHFPRFDPSSSETIEHAAAECRRLWGIHADAPIGQMVRVLENAGAIVGTFEESDDSVDALSWHRTRPLILLRRVGSSVSRARFSLAHECGHIVLHRGIPTGDLETEAQADAFASALLLPAAAFWREFPRPKGRLDWHGLVEFKKRWGVSIQATMRRAFDLGIVGASVYRWFHIRVSQLGWRTAEPGEPNYFEAPEMLAAALTELACDSSWCSTGELDLRDEDVEQLCGVRLPTRAIGNVVPLRSEL
jgi:Zn-dependent peptidase ImmA (M78 family)/DNA-binding XRE family transcriptional regulator